MSWSAKKLFAEYMAQDRLPDDPYNLYAPMGTTDPPPEVAMAACDENLGTSAAWEEPFEDACYLLLPTGLKSNTNPRWGKLTD